jgi:5-(aminomethyl)-3-furanmethanol phosphate kinase
VSASSRPTVIKLGGSLSESGRIASILKMVGRARLACVIVPGGGTFADVVRAAQVEHGFSEAAAHRMAVLAMHQAGMMLCAIHARLQPAETLAGIRRAIAQSRVPVWLPMKLVDGDRSISRDWNTTSDGLAARLAERLGSAPVVLVKSCRVPRSASAVRLAREGIVDPTFAAIVERGRLSWRVLGAGDEAELADLLGVSHRPGRRAPAARAIARQR